MLRPSSRGNLGEAAAPHDDHEVVDLLRTTIRREYQEPPLKTQVANFVKTTYSPKALIPSLTWVPEMVKGGWRDSLRGDIAAGMTVGAFLVPQGMSYALVAELPPIYGLYTASVPLIIYALLGTSRQLAIGPVAIVSLLIGHGVGAISHPTLDDGSTNPEYVSLCIAASLLSGLLQILMSFTRLGFITSFLSHPVVSGFTSAAALIIGFGQLRHVLGFKLKSDNNLFVVAIDMFSRLGEAHWPSILMGFLVMCVLYAFKTVPRLKKLPSAMIIVFLSTLLSWALNLGANHGFKIAGDIPSGIPAPSAPSIPSGEKLSQLFTAVLILTLIGYCESIAVGLTYASKNRYEIRSDQELLAFGVANVVGSFFGAYPVAGGFGRSAVNANSGAKTQLAGAISGIFILIVLAALTPLFYHLPKPALGAIVIMAVQGLLDYQEPIHLYKMGAWGDFVSNVITFLATLLVGPELGIGVGVGCSLLTLIALTSSPSYSVLGNVRGSNLYYNIAVMEPAKEVPHTLIIRFDADLWFANCARFKEAVLREAAKRPDLSRVILCFQAVNMIDSSALHALHEVVRDLKNLAKGMGEDHTITVALSGARRAARKRLIAEFSPSSFLKPGENPSRTLCGRSTTQLKRIFDQKAYNGSLTQTQADFLVKKLIEMKGTSEDELETSPSIVFGWAQVISEDRDNNSCVVGFEEFLKLLRHETGEEEPDPNHEIVLYPNVHAAVCYDLLNASEPDGVADGPPLVANVPLEPPAQAGWSPTPVPRPHASDLAEMGEHRGSENWATGVGNV
mmetsp:Transcript_43649/g.105490  ORF Transcript_43649/g.105490 Transcript_43649/m.105490 type:complete len:790 (+) Transcript_43649:273-2642(+)